MTKTYHEDTDQKAHEEYIRVECLELALKRYPDKPFPELVEHAKEIEKYIFGRYPADVVKLVPDRKAKKK